MEKKGLTQANTLRSNNTTSTGYGIVYADEIIGSRSVKTKEDLNKLPDWVLGKDNKLEKGTTYYVENEKCFYIYTGDRWQKSFKSIGLPVKLWYAYDNDVTGTTATSQILDISKIINSDDLYIGTRDGIEEQPHPFATIVVYNDEVNKVPIAYITLFESSDPDNPENNTVVASAKVFGVITKNVFPKTPDFNNINYYEGNCRPLDTGTQITNWKHTGGNSIVDKVGELNHLSFTGNTIKTSEIDFTAATLQKFNNSVSDTSHNICTQYSVVDVTHNNIVGQMLLIGDSLGHMVTEILTTSATLNNGVINWNEHSDTVVNTYIRRNHVKEGGNSSIAVGSWSKWTYYSGEGQYNDFKILVAGELNKKVNTSDVVQQTGNSTTSVMSQNAVSHELATKADTEQVNNSLYNLEKKIGDRFTNLPDEEDLTSVNESGRDVLKLADRSYAPEKFSGKGYKILRKNMVDGNNILTQDMINEPNTIYEIRYDFDLNNQTINIPDGCILKFKGGSFLNAKNINGKVLNEYLMPEWFGGSPDGTTDCTDAFCSIIKICKNIKCSCSGKYLFKGTVDARLYNNITIDMNLSSFIDFHIIININDNLTDWRYKYTTTGLVLKNGTIASKGIDKKYLNWETPAIISGGPLYLYHIRLSHVPYFIALADEYIDHFEIDDMSNISYGPAYDDISEYSLDVISLLKKDGTFAKLNERTGMAGDSWSFSRIAEFHNPHFISLPIVAFTEFKNCIQINVDISGDYSRVNFISCHWERTKVTCSTLNSTTVVNFIGCFFYLNAKAIDLPGVAYIGCYFRGVSEPVSNEISLSAFLNNKDICELKCIFFNCLIGWSIKLHTEKYTLYQLNDSGRNTISLREYALQSFNAKNIGISNTFTSEELPLGNYKYTIYLLSGINVPIAKREFTISITEKGKAVGFYINNAPKGYGFLVYREGPNGKIYKVKGMSAYDQKTNNVTFFDNYDTAFIGEHDNWMNTFVFVWKEVANVKDEKLYPHLYYANGQIMTINGTTDSPVSVPNSYSTKGKTTERPVSASVGFQYFDTDLAKTICWNGKAWINLDGSKLNVKKIGSTEDRPSNVEIGFIYKDTTLNKLILWEGTKWVNLDGTEIS